VIVEYKTLLVDKDAGIATVWLNRPEARNAVNVQFCLDLAAVFEALHWDDTVRVVLLCGKGPVFCAGADMKESAGWNETQFRQRKVRAREANARVAACAKPVIAVVQGAAVGVGGDLMLSADFAYAAEGTIFRWPEVTRGTVGGTQKLARRVGKPQAKEILFTGRTVDAAEALRLGLVNRVLPASELAAAALETARQIAAQYPVSLAETKRAIDIGTEVPLATGIEVEWSGSEIAMRENEWRQGIQDYARGRR